MKLSLTTFVYKNKISFDIDVNPSLDTVLVLKNNFTRVLKIMHQNQNLFYKGALLKKERLVSDYGIQEGDEIIMETNGYTGSFTIRVKDTRGENISDFSVDYYNTIYQVKKLLQIFRGTFITKQCLNFEGKELEESKKLEDYHIGPQSILTLRII